MSQPIVPCLGKPFRLGSLYDCRTDTLLDETLWDENVIESVLQTKLEGSETVDIITANSMGDKMKVLGFNPGLRLNMLSGALSDTGIAGPIVNFLREEMPPINHARIHLRYATTSSIEEINPDKIKVPCNRASEQATHVVFKIQHGTDAFFAFDCPVKVDETRPEVQSSMQDMMESLKHSICANSECKSQGSTLAFDGEQAQKFECKYYHSDGAVSSPKSPKTLADVKELCRDLPLNLANKNTFAVPKRVWLFPLSQLSTDNDTTQIKINEVSEAVATNVQKVLEDIDEHHIKVGDLMRKHCDILSKVNTLHNDLCNFQKLDKSFSGGVKERIRSHLPEVRCGNASENELIENIDQTPFQPECLSKWLDQKQKEIQVFSGIILSDLSMHGIEFVESIPQSDGEVDTVVHFVCNVTQENDVLLDAMGKHMQTKQQGNWLQESSSKENLTQVSERFKLFTAYAESNKDRGNVKFLVVDCNYDYSSDCGTVVLSRRGGTRQAFQLPSKPGAPRINPSSATRSSVQLQWTKPEKGSENIEYYNVYFYPQNCIPNQLSDWTCCRTLDSSEYLLVNQLNSKTKYTFRVCPVLQQVPDIICVESDHVTIDLASCFQTEGQDIDNQNICQPGKPRATSLTHDKINLEWSKPKYGSAYVEMYIVYYRLETDRDWESIPPLIDSECELVEQMSIGEDYLKPNKKYVFKVKPFYHNPDIEIKESEVSDPIETVPVCQPGKPTAVAITHNSIKLKWSKPMFGSESIDYYTVHYRKYNEEKWSKRKSTQGPQETLMVKGLDLNVQYVFKVTPILSNSRMKEVSSEVSDPIETEQTCQTSKPKLSVVTHNSITVMWDKPEHGGDHVNFYYLYCRPIDKPENKQNILTTESTTLKLSELEVGAKYIFRVKPDCADKSIKAIDSEDSDEIETKPTCQPGKPVEISRTHNSVSLKWDKPEYYHENVELYTISYSSSVSKFLEWSKQRTSKPQESIEVKCLSVGEKYIFKVNVVCSDAGCNVAESDPSDIIETMATSNPGKPTCSNVQHNKVDVQWKHPEYGGENVVSYTVVSSLMGDSSSVCTGTPTEMHIPMYTNSTTITGLTSNSKYCFKVIPDCRTGDGMESDTSDPVQTSPACQTNKPIASNITHNSVTLTWGKPGYRSDQIKCYRVLCHSLPTQHQGKGVKSDVIQKVFEIKGTKTSVLLSSLEMDTEYSFKVVPVCRIPEVIGFESEESETIRTRATSAPHSLKSGTVTHDSVQMKWSKPKQKLRSPKISSYRLSYHTVQGPTNDWKIVNTETKAEDKITVSGLIASTKYAFKVCATYATEAQVGTESDTIIVETKPSCKPGILQVAHVSHNAIQLQWTQPEHFAKTIQHYTVSYRALSDSVDGQWNIATACQNGSTIENLEVNTSYVFKVEPACNSKKIVTQSTESDVITTKASSKPGTPKARIVFHDSVDLVWGMPQHVSQNVTSFIILYRSTTETDESNWQQQECDGTQTSMTVSGLSLKTTYVFKVYPKCRNGEGSESDVSSPIQTKATSPPSKPLVTETTHNSVTLCWKHPKYGNICVKDYTVLSCSSETYTNVETIVTAQECITVTGLAARTKYNFKVVPNCENGTGSESEYSDCVETKPSCKTGTPKAGIITHESVELKWSRPDFQSDTIEHYSISYWNISNPHNASKFNTDGPQESVTIQGLYLNTLYKFEVTPCCTDSEVGIECNGAIVTTKATSKPGTPYATATTHNCIQLKWDKPKYGSELVDSYTVSCRLKNSKKWMSQVTDGPQESIIVRGLNLNEKYLFKVQSKCIHCEGSESDVSESIVTRATSPPGKPVASDVTHNSVLLTWSPPEVGCSNVSAYTVLYRSIEHRDTEWKTQKSSVTSFSITGLTINTKYIFKVKSECKSGLIGSEGNPSDCIKTKATSRPGKPHVISSTNDSVQLEWSKPEQGSENIKSYIVLFHHTESDPSLHYDSMNWQQYNTNSSNNNAFVSGLTVKTQYVFNVLPVCFSGTGSMSNNSDLYWTKATSPPSTPAVIHISHDTVQLKWSKPVYGSENVEHYVISCRVERGPSQGWDIKTEGAKEFVTVSKLIPGSSYIFTVRSECTGLVKGMESDSSKPIKTKLTSSPGKPIAVSKEITHSTISLEWTKPQIGNEFVEYYSVYYKLLDMPRDQWLCSTNTSSDSAMVSQLTPQTKYIFKVEPVCETGVGCESECSDVIVTKPSSKPGKPFATFVGHDTVSLKWDKPEYGSECVEKYIVSFYMTKQPEKKHDQKGTKECSLRICKLTPNTQYVFEVYPKFKSGTGGVCSNLSEPIKTTATSKPGKPKVLEDMVTHNGVQLKWNEPSHGKNNISHYSIQYRLLQGSDWVSQLTKCSQTQGTVSGLTPGEKYVFKLCAICREGEGSESETSDVVETKSTSPPSPPTASLGAVSHNSIQLKWSKPRTIGREIVSYSVFYQKSAAKSQEWTRKHTNGLQETIILDHLSLNTKYDIYVQPECRTSTGTTSKTTTFKTKATSKPGKPSASLVLHDEIHLKWTKPKHGIENISSYTLSYQSIDEQQGKWIKLQIQNIPTDESTIVSGLNPGTKYVFKLMPQCISGTGTESDASDPIEMKVTSKPGTPEVYVVGHNSLNVHWTIPEYGSNSVIGYVVHYKEDSPKNDWKYQECDINDTVVGGLTPGKKYIFVIQPKCNNGVGAKSNDSDSVETRSTSPPGKPRVSQSNGSISHDSIAICWTAPTYGAKNVTGYTIYYRIRDDTVENWKACKVHSPTILTQPVNKLQAKTNYIFKVCSICSTGIGAESECSDPIETKPSCKPGKPTAYDLHVTHESMRLRWDKPKDGNVLSYTVYYKEVSSSQWSQESTTKNNIKLEKLKHKTEYHIQVYPQIQRESGIGIECSELTTIQTKHIPLAERMKANSHLIERGEPGCPDVYQVPIQTVSKDEQKMIRKCFVGEDIVQKNTFHSGKVIMLVGATGTGKTTLINGLVNHVLGVEWKHSYRFKMIFEDSQTDQTKSQTKWITSYTIQKMEESPIRYPLTIIDTPGFGDTEGIERDQRLVEQIRAFFCTKGDEGIDQIHAIGFATQSGLARLTQLQKYIFHSVMSVFGNDVKDNIFMMTTFADGQPPPVLKAVEEAGVPYHKAFKFNNSALFAANSANSAIDKMFWEMGKTSFKEFFGELSHTTPKSLTLTKQVLEEREHLEVCVEGLLQQVRAGLSKIDALRQEEQILKKHEAQLRLNQEFTYTIEITKQRKVDLDAGQHVLNCNCTCHYPCFIPKDEEKHSCAAMGVKRHTHEAQCTVCPGKCYWNMHVNNPYRFELYQDRETKTSEDLKQRFHDARGGKLQVENMIAKLNQGLDDWYQELLILIRRTQEILKRLQDIALKPNPLTEVGYIELLIESEKLEARPGYQKRIQSLQKLKEKAKILRKLPQEEFSSRSGRRQWESFLKPEM